MNFGAMFGATPDTIRKQVSGASTSQLKTMLADLRAIVAKGMYVIDHGGEKVMTGDLVKAVRGELESRGAMAGVHEPGESTWQRWTLAEVKKVEQEIENTKKTLRRGGLSREDREDLKQDLEDMQRDVTQWYANSKAARRGP